MITLIKGIAIALLIMLMILTPFSVISVLAEPLVEPFNLTATQPQFCNQLTLEDWQRIITPEKNLTLESGFQFLPDTTDTIILINGSDQRSNITYCAALLQEKSANSLQTLEIIKANIDDSGKTKLLLSSSKIDGFWWDTKKLMVVSLPINSQTKTLNLDSPGIVSSRYFRISSFWGSLILAIVAVLVFYEMIVRLVALQKGSISRDPVVLTAGAYGKASLSQLQIFCFTLLVLGKLVYGLLLGGILGGLSTDILLLLGISAVGSVGSKGLYLTNKRLSFENWTWLRNEQWLTAFEQGLTNLAEEWNQLSPKQARWGDLLRNNQETSTLDVYSLQLAGFSLLVAFSLLITPLNTLEIYNLPDSFLGVLGLSNVVYLGGKVVTPNSFSELDEHMNKLRENEKTWLLNITDKLVKKLENNAEFQISLKNASQEERFWQLMLLSPHEYTDYLLKARLAGTMLRTLYGQTGTFGGDTMEDRELIPTSIKALISQINQMAIE